MGSLHEELEEKEKENQKGLIASFSRVWLRDDIGTFSQGKAAIIAASILRWSSGARYASDYASLCNFIVSSFNKCKSDGLISPLLALKGVIGNGSFSGVFVREGGVDRLAHILFENDHHRQVIYLSVYNLWALTLSGKGKLLVLGQLIEKLVNLANFNEMVVLFGLFPVLSGLDSDRKAQEMEDDELKKSVGVLLDSLEKSVISLS